MKQVFIDVETTGLNPETDKITEISMIYRKNGKTVKTFTCTNRTVLQKNTLAFLDSIVDKFDSNDKAYFLAYNAKFDADFIRNFLKETGKSSFGNYFHKMPVDILQLAAYKFMLKDIIPENFKLMTVARQLGIRINEDRLHNAEYDINITLDVYKKLRKL